MTKPNYRVVFDGKPLPGFDTETVRSAVQSMFNLSDEKTDRLFSGKPKILKSGLTHEQAITYQERLARIGAETELASLEEREPEPLTVKTSESEPPTAEPLTTEAPEAPEASADSIRQAGFQFTGNGKEYFGIWIVNILLTIVTLGIYSAWATVRNNQYFYGNTKLDDASFQYLAKPLTILKGRLIALAVFAAYVVLSNLYVEAGLVFAVLLIPAVPWIMIKSLRFKAVNSAYRNIRFDFQGQYGQAFMVTFVWPLLNMLTLLLLTPVVIKKTHEFIANGSRYGTSEFTFHATNGHYYRFFGKGLLIALGFGVAAFLALRSNMQVVGMVIGIIGYIAVFGYFIAGIANLFLNSVQLSDHGFESELEPMQMVWIYFSNSLLVGLTLGLYTPWAKCRIAKYRASRTSMLVDGDLDQFVAAEENRTSALGQELGDAFDVDFAAI
ncbi:YjgN family protein [Marinobacter sp. CHS3-4]|uniref:YjgN family protein n=1 Tax=Marinobacter sp. CHS3-4 TaxID=3045174 RepID=UPI0024B559C9|nr:YjgN family protein [Marinobacter sp. CHS3-4]MDI9244287.1 YjgN family protein [Marinobacter sp. CHS3-4]